MPTKKAPFIGASTVCDTKIGQFASLKKVLNPSIEIPSCAPMCLYHFSVIHLCSYKWYFSLDHAVFRTMAGLHYGQRGYEMF